ncbi:TetR/AcrR family transcriptional regulator [Acidovorax sp. Be4]|uniref:TetR/AcrR family transcriptional regulator n=1 Tax=Acidovorax bellezanensis TaxID=2976702 RepID=A0ABT2PJW5_9BURK|nr:TetR/AcrR family transcriptional regulator [Acidovorax sp. Be4]MCT9810779.1 TetR/AcrR family transcriptional regulator [Acidovorax sp. Be4]
MGKTLTSDEFLDELTQLLLAEGISSLTVGEMAARLHCSRRRLYDIAATKEELFCVAVERFFRGILDEGEALIGKEQELTAALAAYLSVGVRAAGRISVPFLKDVEDSDPARACFDAYQQTRTMRLSQLVDEGVRQGVFVACHGRVVSELILGAALRLRRPAFLAQADLTIEEAFQEFYRVLLGGLLAKTPAPGAAAKRVGLEKAPPVPPLKPKGKNAGDDDADRMLMAAWNRS